MIETYECPIDNKKIQNFIDNLSNFDKKATYIIEWMLINNLYIVDLYYHAYSITHYTQHIVISLCSKTECALVYISSNVTRLTFLNKLTREYTESDYDNKFFTKLLRFKKPS